ncbi:MAG: PQQ-dependent sugar dehydrogenase [Pseudomonadota bacterium]
MPRQLRSLFFAGAVVAIAAACSQGGETSAQTPAGPAGEDAMNAAERLAPGGGGGDAAMQKTQAEPAPEGALALNVETVAENLLVPWAIAFLPSGEILVTEQEGRLRIIEDGVLRAAPIDGVPAVHAERQAGLYDVLPHPDYATNKVLYLAYAAGDAKSNATRVARATFDGSALNDLDVIFEAIPLKDTSHHFGGRLAWGPDGHLFLTVGEGSRYKEKAQDFKTSFGAVIRINEDGTLPDDNPDFGPDAAPGLYTKGHRNPQGLAWDAARGVLWSHEHGPRGGDELNIIVPGANYGWPAASFGIDYSGALITPFTEFEGAKAPLKYWTPSIAPSGLAVYDGDLFADWKGDLLVGAMSPTAGRALHRVIIENGVPAGEERYLTDLEPRIRDVRVGPDGAIYIAMEGSSRGDPDGKILRVTPQ